MGCRCRPDRSFHFRGRPFPICARCTGILCGFLAAGVGIWLGTPGLIPLLPQSIETKYLKCMILQVME